MLRVGGPSGLLYIPYPIQLLRFHIPPVINSYVDDFTVSCSNVDQMAEAVSTHSSNIQRWADEQGLEIFAPNFTITLFIPQFA